MKKKQIILLICLLSIIIFTIFYNKPVSYRFEYTVDKLKVVEKFLNNQKFFTFEIHHNDDKVVFNLENKYSYKRGLIKSINVIDEEDYYCYEISGLIPFYKICKDHKNYFFDYGETVEKLISKNHNYKLYDFDETLFFWNYKGFYFIKNGKMKEIKLLNNDVYNPDKIIRTNKYLLVPDYSKDHFFNKMFLIDSQTGTKKEIKLNHDINFEFQVLSFNDKRVAIYDLKNEKEINIFYLKGKSEIVKNKKYSKKQLESLLNINNSFVIRKSNIEYNIGYKYVTVETNVNPTIVYQTDTVVYYIINNTLYKFDIYKGLNKIAEYDEWNFNKENLIYIY